MATDETFHEMGVWSEVEAFLEQGSQDENIPPDQRIKALDGLAFADLKVGSTRAATWLDQMDVLIAKHDLGEEERLRVDMKRMNFLARKGDRRGAMCLVEKLTPIVQAQALSHQRVFSYSVACAELDLGDADAAADRVEPLIRELYVLIGFTPEMLMGKNAQQLWPMLKNGADVAEVKHLADSLDLLAKIYEAQGKVSPLLRVHALKFYELARARDSLLRVGQDLVEQFVNRSDFDGALHMMETILLPQLQNFKLANHQIPVRSQYAVVLAYCERYSDAEAEMNRLKPYETGLHTLGQKTLVKQRKLIANLRAFGPPPKWSPPQGLLDRIARKFGKDV